MSLDRTNSDRMSAPDPRAILDEIAKRMHAARLTIIGLADIYGLDPAPWLNGQQATAPIADSRQPIADSREPAAPTAPTRRGKKAKPRESRPTNGLSEIQKQILAALKEAGDPVRPGEVAKALKMDVQNLRYHTATLIKDGVIKATGTTSTRRLSLP